MSVAEYAARWPRLHAVRRSTRRLYEHWLEAVWLPAFGLLGLEAVTRQGVLEVLDVQRARGLKPGTVRSALGVFRGLLADARDDGLVQDNVATRLGRRCGRVEPVTKALDATELAAFLCGAATHRPMQLPLFLTLARAGVRVGEALALAPRHVDLHGRTIEIAGTRLRDGTIVVPKTRASRRRVDVSQQLARALRPLVAHREPWLFGTRRGPLPYHAVGRDFAAVRDAVGLRRELTPHSLRHTYASLLIARGVSPAYVQRQLGHASIALTLDLYGHHLPYRNLAAVDGLDDDVALGSSAAYAPPPHERRLRRPAGTRVSRSRPV